jgi:DNA polymerase I
MSDQPEDLMLLVDGSSYLYRAYHAMPDLRSPDGFPTGAIHGMVAMMKWLREQYPAAHAACVFDAKGPTFRDDWYPEYKAQRAPMPDAAARSRSSPSTRWCGCSAGRCWWCPASRPTTPSARWPASPRPSGHQVVISTGDKDLAQLVTPQVTLINTMSNERLDVGRREWPSSACRRSASSTT